MLDLFFRRCLLFKPFNILLDCIFDAVEAGIFRELDIRLPNNLEYPTPRHFSSITSSASRFSTDHDFHCAAALRFKAQIYSI